MIIYKAVMIMATNKWKFIAIVFMTLFFLETFAFVGFFSLGQSVSENDVSCMELCSESQNSSSYYYDIASDTCFCYDRDGDVIKQEEMTVW